MSKCKSCGGFVTDDYARVFGDNENNVFDCRNCRAGNRKLRGSDDDEDEGRTVLLRNVREDDPESEEATATAENGSTSRPVSADSQADTRQTPPAAADGGTAVSAPDHEPDVETTSENEADAAAVEASTPERVDEPDGEEQSRFGRLLSVFRY